MNAWHISKYSVLLLIHLCSTLCHPIDCSTPGSPAPGISQARKLEWITILFSKGSSQSRDWTQVSCTVGRFFTNWATREVMAPSIQYMFSSVQFRSVAQSCPTLCDPMNRSMPGLPVHHQLPEFTQTHGHRVSDAIHPSQEDSLKKRKVSKHQESFSLPNLCQALEAQRAT